MVQGILTWKKIVQSMNIFCTNNIVYIKNLDEHTVRQVCVPYETPRFVGSVT